MPDVLGIPQRQCITSLRHVHRLLLTKIGEFVSASKDMQDVTALWQQLARDSGTRTLPECIQLLMKILKDTNWPDCNTYPGLNLDERICVVPLAADIILSTVMQFHGERGTRLNKKLLSILSDMESAATSGELKQALLIILNGAKPRKDIPEKQDNQIEDSKSFLSRVQRLPSSQQSRGGTALRPDGSVQAGYSSGPSSFQKGWGSSVPGSSMVNRNLGTGLGPPSSTVSFPVSFRQDYPGQSGRSSGLADMATLHGQTPQGRTQSHQYHYVLPYSSLPAERQACYNSLPTLVQHPNPVTNSMSAEQFQALVQRLQQQGVRSLPSIDYSRVAQSAIAGVYEVQTQDGQMPFTSFPPQFSVVAQRPYYHSRAQGSGPPGGVVGSSVPHSSSKHETTKPVSSEAARMSLHSFKPVSSMHDSGPVGTHRDVPHPNILVQPTSFHTSAGRALNNGGRAETSYQQSNWRPVDMQHVSMSAPQHTVSALPSEADVHHYRLEVGGQNAGRKGILLEPAVQSKAGHMKANPNPAASSWLTLEPTYRFPSGLIVPKEVQVLPQPVAATSSIQQPSAYSEVGQASSHLNRGNLSQQQIQSGDLVVSQAPPSLQRIQPVTVDPIHPTQQLQRVDGNTNMNPERK